MKMIAQKTMSGRRKVAAINKNDSAHTFSDASPQVIPVEQIVFSPLNYRKYFD